MVNARQASILFVSLPAAAGAAATAGHWEKAAMRVHTQAITAGYRCIIMILQRRLRIPVILSEPADSRTPAAAVFVAFHQHEHAHAILDILLPFFWVIASTIEQLLQHRRSSTMIALALRDS